MEYEIETAHGRLFCRREGSGPILLLIHGVACDSEFFRETSKHWNAYSVYKHC